MARYFLPFGGLRCLRTDPGPEGLQTVGRTGRPLPLRLQEGLVREELECPGHFQIPGPRRASMRRRTWSGPEQGQAHENVKGRARPEATASSRPCYR
jgi:hypothetical protein